MTALRTSHLLSVFSLTLVLLTTTTSELIRAEDSTPPATTTFRVITYNVQFLPAPASSKNERPQPEYRAHQIADKVSPYDLVALQETFHKQHRSILMDQLRTTWNGILHEHHSPTPEGFYTSGGCLLMTKRAMQDKSALVFTDYSHPQEYGLRADGYAAKGVIHARVTFNSEQPNHTVDVYVTHLEARADHLRPKQYAQMAQFIQKTNDPNRPFLLLGDMNTKGQRKNQQDPQSQYTDLFRRLRAACPANRITDVWPLLRGDALGGTTKQESDTIGKRIDYIIVGNPQPPHPQITPVAIEVNTFQDTRVGALSDHNGVVATFQWQQTQDPLNTKTLEQQLNTPRLNPEIPQRELQAFISARIPKFLPPTTRKAWEQEAHDIRRKMLERVIFRGHAVHWRTAKTQVEWLDTLEGGPGYQIRKLRYEALPGFWIPALLYEPQNLTDKMPVFINVNGHHAGGKAMPYKQRRCINLARRGMLAFNLEFIDMGQLRGTDNRHNRLVQLDLCGTSGLAPFYLTLERGLSAALAHPHADPTRVGVAGLSGGGWQTIFLAALDPRITLANPVAGYSSLLDRIQKHRDVGDAEQIPSDMATVGDYTHLTALLAPRPSLLTYNDQDNCCFLPPDALPKLEQAAHPIYQLFDQQKNFRTHINHNPGTHNFDRDNREALYRLVGDHFFSKVSTYNSVDLPIPDDEIRTEDELSVSIPDGNATLHQLASQLSQPLPSSAQLPSSRQAATNWQLAGRQRLRKLVGWKSYQARALPLDSTKWDDVTLSPWHLILESNESNSDHSQWTVPVVILSKPYSKSTVLLIGDEGYGALATKAKQYLDQGQQVVLVDLLGFGQSKGHKNVDSELLLIATVGQRPLGIQAAQLAAITQWASLNLDDPSLEIVATGPRSGIISLVAAGVEPDVIAAVRWQHSWGSLKEFIEQNWTATDAPELCCFGLLQEFDVPQLIALVAPRPVTIDAPKQKVRNQLRSLKSWYALLDADFEPLQ
jgi:endonuclease/exonuclease/phosphatase family metal-dependent hydrolase